MPILDAELRNRVSENMTQTNSGGGRETTTLKATNTLMGDDISPEERTYGGIRHYKYHIAADDDDGSIYKNSMLYLRSALNGSLITSLIKADHYSTWADDSSGRKYGTAVLSQAITSGSQTIVATGAGASYGHFANGDTIILTSRSHGFANISDTGVNEVLVIDQAPSWNGTEVTLHVSTPIQNNYPVSRTQDGVTYYTNVCAAIEYGNVAAAYTAGTKTSAAGTYDTGAAVVVKALDALTQALTFTFTSATNFNVTSNRSGVTLLSGAITSEYDSDYITIPAAFWTGTWASGDSLVLNLTPATLPVHVVVTVPAGAPQDNLSYLELWTKGSSASA